MVNSLWSMGDDDLNLYLIHVNGNVGTPVYEPRAFPKISNSSMNLCFASNLCFDSI